MRVRFILWRMSLATNGSLPREMTPGEPSFHAVERRGDSWSGRKVWASGFLELGFHNNGSHSFSLGRPDPRKLETEICAFDPPHQGFVDAHWPLLVVKEQGQAERRADLHLGKGRRLTPVRGEIEDRCLPLEVILSKKE
jgi:hypothetical protein